MELSTNQFDNRAYKEKGTDEAPSPGLRWGSFPLIRKNGARLSCHKKSGM